MRHATICIVLLASMQVMWCATMGKHTALRMEDTNPMKTEESVKGIDIRSLARDSIPADAYVALLSLEENRTFWRRSLGPDGVSLEQSSSAALDWGV